MNSSFQNTLSHLNEKVVNLLWHQWSSIGVAGYSRGESGLIIDPEALLLATTHYGRYDARLMDESIDWLVKFGNSISIQRLQGLERSWINVADPRILSAVAAILSRQSAHRKWRKIAERDLPDAPSEAFFRDFQDEPSIFSDNPEPIFAKYGLMRGKLELRDLSQAPDSQVPDNLIFTLRALLGVNARAEIMAWLLTHESGHPAKIADDTGYFSKSIQQILNEMAGSGQLNALRISREKHFSLRYPEKWRALLDPRAAEIDKFPRWTNWMPLFSAIIHLSEALRQLESNKHSESFRAIKLREALIAATPALAAAGRIHRMRATPELRGAQFISALLSDIESLIPAPSTTR